MAERHLLNSVEAPGCITFEYKAFADCVSLQHIRASGGDNAFVGTTKLAPYLFDACINLSNVTLMQAVMDADQSTSEQHATPIKSSTWAPRTCAVADENRPVEVRLREARVNQTVWPPKTPCPLKTALLLPGLV